MMEPMDELFKKKLDAREIPFNEAHWVAAQQMLDDRDARKGAIWWWRTGLSVIAVVVLIVAFIPMQEIAVEQVQTNLSNDLGAYPESNLSTGDKAILPDESISENTSAVKRPIAEGTNAVSSPKESNIGAEPERSTSESISKAQAKAVQGAGKVNTVSVIKTADGVATPENVLPGATRSSEELLPALPPQAIEQENSSDEEPVIADRILVAPLDEITRLSFNVVPGDQPENKDLPDRCWPVRKQWAVYTVFGGSLPARNTRAGAVLGLGVSWPGTEKWGLYAEGLYRIQELSALPTQTALQRSYGFGVTESAYALHANSLHYLDLNLGATYKLKRHQFHIGAGGSYLVGVRGRLDVTQKEESELTYNPSMALSEGWISKEGVSGISVRGHAGYDFELFSHLYLVGRIQYNATPVFSDSAPGNPQLSPVSFDLMIKYELW